MEAAIVLSIIVVLIIGIKIFKEAGYYKKDDIANCHSIKNIKYGMLEKEK